MSQITLQSPIVREKLLAIAKEENLPIQVVEQIVLSQFKFIRDTITQIDITKSNKCTILVPKFGKYSLSERKVKYITQHNIRNNEANLLNKTT